MLEQGARLPCKFCRELFSARHARRGVAICYRLGRVGWQNSDTSRNVRLWPKADRCPYRKLDPDIVMVESTEHISHFDTPLALNGCPCRKLKFEYIGGVSRPEVGTGITRPVRWTSRAIGASFCTDTCVRTSL
jgi:hypothetical protein